MSSEISRNLGVSLFVSSICMFASYRLLTARNASRVARTLSRTSNDATRKQPPQKIPKAAAPKVSDSSDACACEVKPNDMLGTVKNYDRHVVICVPPGADKEWLNDISLQAATFPYCLDKSIDVLVKAAKKARKTLTDESASKGSSSTTTESKKAFAVKVTAMVLNPEDPCSADFAKILVYPDNLAFDLFPDQVDSFAELVMQPVPLKEAPLLTNFTHSVPWFGSRKLLLVCTHMARDKRCGTKGPELISNLESHLRESEILYSDDSNVTTITTSGSDVAHIQTPPKPTQTDNHQNYAPIVRGSSHIGGHVYAGTMIVYPEGRWYGRVSAQNVPELLMCIKNNTVYDECLRGSTCSDVLQW